MRYVFAGSVNAYEFSPVETGFKDEWELDMAKTKSYRTPANELLVVVDEVGGKYFYSIIKASRNSTKMKYIKKDVVIPQWIAKQYHGKNDLQRALKEEIDEFGI